MTTGDVYEIYCDESTVITKDFINHIRENKMTVILKIEGHASWITLDGSKMEAPSESAIDTPIADFIANGIALNEKRKKAPTLAAVTGATETGEAVLILAAAHPTLQKKSRICSPQSSWS